MTQEEQADIIQQLASVLREGNTNADVAALPSESQARAQELMQEAIYLVEELTGEAWNFSFTTWG